MRTNSFVHTVIDYIKDILAQFNVSKQRETSIFMASDDFQSRQTFNQAFSAFDHISK